MHSTGDLTPKLDTFPFPPCRKFPDSLSHLERRPIAMST